MTREDHRMHGTALDTGQHDKGDLQNTGQISGDDITLAHAHGLKNIGHLLDFSVEGEIRISTHLVGILADPNKGQLIAACSTEVISHRVGDNVGLNAGEPLKEELIRILENFIPRHRSSQLLDLLLPVRN